LKSADTKTIPVAIQKSAEFAKAAYYNIVWSIHSFVQKLEIMGEKNEGFSFSIQSLPE